MGKTKVPHQLERFATIIKNQKSRFPTTRCFDYTQPMKDTVTELDTFFDTQLVNIIDTIAKSTNATKGKCSAF